MFKHLDYYAMDKFKRKMLLLAFVAGFSSRSFFSFAQVTEIDNTFDTRLQGSWDVVQLTIEKNSDGKVETVVVDASKKNTDGKAETVAENTLRDVQSFLPCPQTWEFRESENVVLRFPDGSEETTSYSVEDERFTIRFLGAIHQFRYVVDSNNLSLTITHTYQMNQPSGQLGAIKEKWMIVLEKTVIP